MIFRSSFSLLILTVLVSGSFAQVPRDSLRAEYLRAKGKEDKYQSTLKLAESYLRDSIAAGQRLALEVYREAQGKEFSKFRIIACDLLGRAEVFSGQEILATKYFEIGLKESKEAGEASLTAHLINSLGVLYLRTGQYEKALDYLTQAMNWWEKQEDQLRATYTLINVGTLQTKLDRPSLAIRALERALDQSTLLNNTSLQMTVNKNLGGVYESIEDHEKALTYYQKALELSRQAPNNPSSLISTLGNIHNVLAEQGKYQEAQRYYLEALQLAESQGLKPSMQVLLKQRADVFLKMGNVSAAIDLYIESLTLAEQFNAKQSAEDIYLQLTTCYQQLGNHERALFYHQRFAELRQERYEEVSSTRIKELQAKFEMDEVQKEVVALKEKRKAQQTNNLILILALALLVIALASLYGRYRSKRRAQALLESSNQEIMERNEMLRQQTREIKKKNQLLESQALEIQTQNQQLLQSNDELKQLTYAVSHDLREPLRTIISYLQLLDRRHAPQLEEAGREFLSFANEGARRLQALMTDMLEYSRLGKSKGEPKLIDLETVLDEVEKNLDSHIQESGATLKRGPLPLVYGRPTDVYLLFQNLISNGIKFHHPDRPPILEVRSVKQGSYHVISLKDNGIGIAPQKQERIFQIFQRLHSRDEYDGTGLGLALAQKIVRNHGGDIWCESILGSGTTFFVKIPISPQQFKTHSLQISKP